jgi:hypothetical protein
LPPAGAAQRRQALQRADVVRRLTPSDAVTE